MLPLARRTSPSRSRLFSPRQHALWGMMIGLLTALFVLIVPAQHPLGARLEHDALDLWFALRQPTSPRRVAIVAVDEATVQRWGGRAFDARDMGRLLLLLRRSGVRAAAISLHGLTDKSLPRSAVAALARDLSAAGIAHLPLEVPLEVPPGALSAAASAAHPRNKARAASKALQRFQFSTSRLDTTALGSAAPGEAQRQSVQAPDDAVLRAAAGAGHLVFTLDPDGRARKMPLALPVRGAWYPALALSVAHAALRPQQGASTQSATRQLPSGDAWLMRRGRPIPAPGGLMMLNYPRVPKGANSAFLTISLAHALAHPEVLRPLRGKVVVVGLTAPAMTSLFSTPDGRRVAGAELHAIASENLLSGDILRPAPLLWTWLLTLLPCLAVGGFVAARHPLWGGGAALLCLSCSALLSFVLFERDVWLDISAPWLGIAATFVIGIISQARRQERDSTHIASTIDALAQVSEIIAAQTQQKHLLDRVLQWTVNVMGAVGASALLLDEDAQVLRFAAATGPKAHQLMPFTLEIGAGIAGWVAQHGAPVIVNDAAHDPRFTREFDEKVGFTTDAILCVPLRVRDKMLGVIEVVNRVDGAPFTEADLELLTAVANQAAVVVENARLYEMLSHRVVQSESELARTNQRLETEKNLLHTVLESMTDGVVVTDENSLVQLINPAAAALLPELAIKTRGVPLSNLLPDFSIEEALAEAGRAVVLQRGDIDAPRLIETRMVPLQCEDGEFVGAAGEFVGAVAVFADVTEERHIEQAKSDFVSFVAHEMRSPLTSISGFSSMLRSSEAQAAPALPDTSRARFLSIIHDESERLTRLINSLLDVARIEAGHAIELLWEEVDFAEVAQSAADSQRCYSSRHHILCDVAPDLPPLKADRDKLKQVLINLLSNALKYSPGGNVMVRARRDGEFLQVSVSDEGPGIAPEQRALLFERFGRTAARNPKVPLSGPGERAKPTGTGLGLFLTKHLVSAHGGRIWVDDQPGSGAIFHFTLPLVHLANDDGRAADEE